MNWNNTPWANTTASKIDIDTDVFKTLTDNWKKNLSNISNEEDEALTERTFVMIKPDAFQRGLVGEIFDAVQQRGFKLIACKTVQLTPSDCEKHYSHHVGKSFFPDLVEFMTSGPSLALVFEGENICHLVRQLIGDSKHPIQVPAASVRGRYAMDFPRNLVHGSDTHDDALREYHIYLSDEEVFTERRVEQLKAENEKKRAERLADIRAKIKKGISLGDEIFAVDVLKPGDWVADDTALLQITACHKQTVGDDEMVFLQHKDYAVSPKLFAKINENWVEPESVGLAWFGGNPLKLVGRDGKFLKGYTSPVFNQGTHKAKRFKEGKWLPVFTKQSEKKMPKLNPFATAPNSHKPFAVSNVIGNDIFHDIFDPKNNSVMRVVRPNIKDTQKWRVFTSDGKDLTSMVFKGKMGQYNGDTAVSLFIGKTAVYAPEKLSVLFHNGQPYLTTYGDYSVNTL